VENALTQCVKTSIIPKRRSKEKNESLEIYFSAYESKTQEKADNFFSIFKTTISGIC
jgi:hypothetical protein